MNYSAILDALKEASAFELFRLRAAIDRVLADPKWIAAIAARVRRGARIEFFDARENRLRSGLVLEMRRAHAVVLDVESATRVLIDYAAINLDGADVAIRERPTSGLGRQEIAVGDTIGFQDQDGQQRFGAVTRLNDKTVTLDCDGQRWRVAYAFLHRLIDSGT